MTNTDRATAAERPTPGTAAERLHGWPEFSSARIGIFAFLVSEAAFFSTLILTYLVYLGQSRTGPYPNEVLGWPVVSVNSLCLFSSSGTIALALRARNRGRIPAYERWMMLTILLGTLFVAGTAYEWKGLIFDHGLTINTNLFGTTFFTLVGFHAGHVTVGVITMSTMVLVGRRGWLKSTSEVPELVSYYWHFVDVVWVFILTVVYIYGR